MEGNFRSEESSFAAGVCFEKRLHPLVQHCSHENIRIDNDHLSGLDSSSGGAFAWTPRQVLLRQRQLAPSPDDPPPLRTYPAIPTVRPQAS
jgi:hypothetical protein